MEREVPYLVVSCVLAGREHRFSSTRIPSASGLAVRDGCHIPETTRFFLPMECLAIAAPTISFGPEFQGKKGWNLPVSFFLGCLLYYLARRVVH